MAHYAQTVKLRPVSDHGHALASRQAGRREGEPVGWALGLVPPLRLPSTMNLQALNSLGVPLFQKTVTPTVTLRGQRLPAH